MREVLIMNSTIQPQKRMRFAIYARYSSEMQSELSIEAQIECCTRAIGSKGGVVVATYADRAKSGWSLERDDFQQLQHDAARGKFDAIMFWKFDRLARNFEQAVTIKALLRHEYGIKLYCVEGASEDDEGESGISGMIEHVLAAVAAFYSKNLSNETKRGKRQRAIKGEFNGSNAPVGYILVQHKDATPERQQGLYVDPATAPIVQKAFELYATGDYSDGQIASWMNGHSEIRALRAGIKPMDKEAARWMFENRVYTGRVSHSDTQYIGSLGQRRKGTRDRREWFEGKHEAIISDELFDYCQEVRKQLASTFKSGSMMRTYIMHDRVYCSCCIANKPAGLADDNYGKMRPATTMKEQGGKTVEYSYYRCMSKQRGYAKCGQKYMNENELHEQVVRMIANAKIPSGFKERVEQAVQRNTDNAAALKRRQEIEEILKRVDFQYELGVFPTKEEYAEKRLQWKREYDALEPIQYEEAIEAADLLQNFSKYWLECEKTDDPLKARKELMQRVVDRVFVSGQDVLAVVLHGKFALVLDKNETAPANIADAVRSSLANEGITSSLVGQLGADGVQLLLCTKFGLYLLFVPNGIPVHSVIRELFQKVIDGRTIARPMNIYSCYLRTVSFRR
jgi:DNA invertase Pin-like site-specific DNA recombinase